ncbi:MAG: lysophospholipid acyltransferase family protein [Dehalococcoidia bacterium]
MTPQPGEPPAEAGAPPGRLVRLWHRAAVPIYRTVSYLAQRAPLRLSYWCAARIGDLVFFVFWREKRTITLENMRHVLGPYASRAMVRASARDSVRNYAKYMVEFVRFPRMSRQEILDAIGIASWDRFDALLADGRGVIFVSFHMGNWDFAGAAAGIRGYPFLVVADSVGPPEFNAEVQAVRRRQGLRLVEAEQPALAARGVVKALRAGEMVGLLVDIPTSTDGVPVRLFGETAYLPAGPATLALRTGARIVPGAVFRRPDNRFSLVVDDRFDYTPTGDRQADVQRLTQALVTALEELVRQRPEQWYIFRRLWPTGEPQPSAHHSPAALGADA